MDGRGLYNSLKSLVSWDSVPKCYTGGGCAPTDEFNSEHTYAQAMYQTAKPLQDLSPASVCRQTSSSCVD